jgi:molybdate transport system substrate-binding protein
MACSTRSRLILLACAFLMMLGLVSCGGGSGGGSDDVGSGGGGGEQGGTLTILAASSLTDAFGELGNTFEEQHQGVEVKQSFGASSDLLAQIQQGAPADVFASAAEEEMDTAKKDGLVSGTLRCSSKTARSSWFPGTTPRT